MSLGKVNIPEPGEYILKIKPIKEEKKKKATPAEPVKKEETHKDQKETKKKKKGKGKSKKDKKKKKKEDDKKAEPEKKKKLQIAQIRGLSITGAAATGGTSLTRRRDIVSTFGWDGDKDAAIAFPGSYYIRDGRDIEVAFDIFETHKTHKWFNHSGYLPCLVTEFTSPDQLHVKIMNFADKVRFGANDVVVAYSRVEITNMSPEIRTVDPGAHRALVALNKPEAKLKPRESAHFDYAIAIDRFGKKFDWPSNEDLIHAGSWDEHFLNMRSYWNDKLSEIADLQTPDESLNEAYKAGFIYTHIVKDGDRTHVGENGYDTLWDHDATGILATLLTIGHLSEAKTLLDRLPVSIQFDDGTWKYSWPFALYYNKTGDHTHVLKHWDKIEMSARKISSDRTGPGGIIKITNDIDTKGLWTIDNWSALFGMSCYKYLCEQLGKKKEAEWAAKEYDALLDVLNKTLQNTVDKHKLDYIPASIIEPNDANRCKEPTDANWAAHFFFGRWAWDGWLSGGRQEGPNLDMIDATYDYGFARLKAKGLPPHTYGGYPGYSTAYNAGYAGAALRGDRYRSEGIYNYQFMISNAMSGPYSWWEGILYPAKSTWEGIHPSGGTGSCPHMWGQSCITKVLIESVMAEFYDGRLLVGRGVPAEWLNPEKHLAVKNFPIKTNKRIGATIKALSDKQILLLLEGDEPSGEILFNLPVMRNNIAEASTGRTHFKEGVVALQPNEKSVVVTLIHSINAPASVISDKGLDTPGRRQLRHLD